MRNLLCGLIVLLASIGVAQADNFYTSQADWVAALSPGSSTTINFEGLADVGGYYNYTPGKTVDGVNFKIGPASPSGASFWVMGDNWWYPYAVASSTTGYGTVDFLATLPSSVTALGFNYIVGPGIVTFTLSDGFTTTVDLSGLTGNYFGFFGVTAPGGITKVDITEPYTLGSQSINLRDFSYGTASTVPEPASLSLLGIGLLGAIGVRRRKMNL